MYTLNNYDTTEAKEFQPYENPPSAGYVLKVVGVDETEEGIKEKALAHESVKKYIDSASVKRVVYV